MAEANGSNMICNLIMDALKGVLCAYVLANSAITPEQETIELRNVGNNVVVLGIINAGFAYGAFINPPARNLAYAIPNKVIQGFTMFTGITAVVMGWLLIVSDNPCQYNCLLLKVILLLVLFATAFTYGMVR